ncbi:MAG: SixA phosphatase family protein [Sphingomicrobium sp.]
MKTLLVLRHGKAERDSDSGKDFDRSLAGRGWRDAEAVGREMRARGLDPDAVIASPAKRSAETVTALVRGYGRLEPTFDERIYDAPPARLLEIVNQADDAWDRLLLVGHNPGFEKLVLRLSGDEPCEHRDRIIEGFPTAAVAAIELPVMRWSDVGERSGRIVEMITPRDLR